MYAKAIAAFLTSGTGLGVMMGWDLNISPEIIMATSTILSTVLVYFIPNRSS